MGNKQYPDQLENPPAPPDLPPPGPVYPPPGNQYGFGPDTPPPYQRYGSPPPYLYPQSRQGQVVGFWPRFVATLIDSILVSIPSSLAYGLLFLTTLGWTFDRNWSWQFGPSWGTSVIVWGLYAWFCYSYLNGNTLGKKVMGIKLVNPDGSKPTLATFVLHYTIGYLVNGVAICLGYLWVIFDPYRQTWGQKLFKDSTVTGSWD